MLEAFGISYESSKAQEYLLIHGHWQDARAIAELEDCMLGMPINLAFGLLDAL